MHLPLYNYKFVIILKTPVPYKILIKISYCSILNDNKEYFEY